MTTAYYKLLLFMAAVTLSLSIAVQGTDDFTTKSNNDFMRMMRQAAKTTTTTTKTSDADDRQLSSLCRNAGDACDNGIYCDGPDRCNSSLQCVPTGSDEPCPGTCGQICDEQYQQCVNEHTDCKSGYKWDDESCECEHWCKWRWCQFLK